MHPLEKKIIYVCENYGLILSGEKVVVGVSGGSDSMALIHLLAQLATTLPCSLVVAHVNHGLRPEEAEREKELVAKMAKRLGLPFFETILDVKAEASKKGHSIEQAARELRYGFFDDVAAQVNAVKIAVAHTADDQAEELLIRLLRGSGRKGLSGMCRIRAGRIIRPLLDISKTELLLYLADKGLQYCEDSSNYERYYLRNRVRLDLIPYLKEFNPNIQQVLNQTSAILQEEELVLEELAQQAFGQVVELCREGAFLQAVLDCGQFETLNIAIQRRVAEKIFLTMDAQPRFNNIATVVEFAARKGERQAHFQQGLRLRRNGAQLVFSYPQGKGSLRGELCCRQYEEVTVEMTGSGRYAVPGIDKVFMIELLDRVPDKNTLRSAKADFFDYEKIKFPLLLRNRKPGDSFHPLGAPGRKKVSDFLTDQKICSAKRDLLLVLCCQGQLIAIPGVRIDHAFRVTSSTQKVLKFSVL